MKKFLTIIPLVFLLCFTFGCQQGEETTEEVGVVGLSDEDIEAIRESIKEMKRTMLTGDWDSFVQLYTEVALIMAPNAPIIKGRDAIKQMFSAFTIIEFNSELIEVDGCGEFACGRGKHSWTFEAEGMKEPASDSGKWVATWRKQPDGKWLCEIDIWNSDLPLPQ
jgi:uncharacterized protein (TIGR02246 family)